MLCINFMKSNWAWQLFKLIIHMLNEHIHFLHSYEMNTILYNYTPMAKTEALRRFTAGPVVYFIYLDTDPSLAISCA